MSRRRRFARAVLIAVAIPLVAFSVSAVVARVRYDPAPWLEDYAHLKTHMEVAYANLEWIPELRGLDLAELDRRTTKAIETAGSPRGARGAIGDFVEAFEDGHLRIESGPPAAVAWAIERFRGEEDEDEDEEAGPVAFPAGASGGDVCAWFGYGERDHGFRWDAAALPGWTPLADDGAFPAGTFRLPDDSRAGILRIGHFGEDGYADACAAAWEAEAGRRSGPCDEACLGAFRRRASDALAGRVAERVRALEAAGARALVVDVTGNGGGSEWVEAVARVLSARPLGSTRVTFVRHTHWEATLEGDRSAVAAALTETDLPDATRARLEEALDRLDAALAQVRGPCDRSGLWRGESSGCRQTVTVPLYTTGPFERASAADLAGVDAPGDLHAPLGREHPTGVWRGPLVVLTDGGSASATEEFAALLADNGAATVVGERTHGSGCGYTRGGIPATLPNSGLVVRMPDCARLRADGSNQIAGVAPHVPIEWSGLDDAARSRALVEAVAAAAER